MWCGVPVISTDETANTALEYRSLVLMGLEYWSLVLTGAAVQSLFRSAK